MKFSKGIKIAVCLRHEGKQEVTYFYCKYLYNVEVCYCTLSRNNIRYEYSKLTDDD